MRFLLFVFAVAILSASCQSQTDQDNKSAAKPVLVETAAVVSDSEKTATNEVVVQQNPDSAGAVRKKETFVRQKTNTKSTTTKVNTTKKSGRLANPNPPNKPKAGSEKLEVIVP
jgi:hypothetical protein